MDKKTVLVVCPSAAATSTVVSENIKSFLQENSIPAEVIICTTTEMPSKVKNLNPDLVVSTTEVIKDSAGDVPVLNGIPFLTGQGVSKLKEEIMEIISR